MKVGTVTIAFANIVLLMGCTDQEWHETTSILDNQSGHQITIAYYKGGNINNESSQVLNVGEAKEVFVDSDTGKGRGVTYPTLLQSAGFDSAVVTFDNLKAIHYGYNKTGRNINAITFTNPRNVFNFDNYTEKIILETKKRDEREVKYTFIPEDYEKAK